MKTVLPFLLLFLAGIPGASAEDRPRLAVLTDIGGDPDDQQSLVRLLVYANAFEIEALVASASGTPGELEEAVTRTDLILGTLDAYAKVLPKLRSHGTDWPEAGTLRKTVRSGNPLRGRPHIGEGHETEGSRWLVERIDAGSPERPLNITIWGGQTDFAQAMWSARQGRDAEGWEAFVRKFRVYDIDDQDAIADWMRTEFPGMRYILAKAPKGGDKREGVYRGMYLTGDVSLTSLEWIDANIRSKGPLGALYPTRTWTDPNPHGCMKEGDTPSWFFFLSAGGNDPEDPTKPGWGGRFEKQADGWYRDFPAKPGYDPREEVSRWRPGFQKDFATRMGWAE